MTIQDVVSMINELNDELVIYAKKNEGEYRGSSEVVMLELTEEEQEMPILEVSRKKCPGFYYFLEIFIVKEVIEDFVNLNPHVNLKQKTERVIHYAEFDA